MLTLAKSENDLVISEQIRYIARYDLLERLFLAFPHYYEHKSSKTVFLH